MSGKLTETIYKELSSKGSILLTGNRGAGKSWYVMNELIPYLTKNGLKVQYFDDCINFEDDKVKNDSDIVIVDEVESMLDRERIELEYKGKEPYYKKKYLKQVRDWNKKLSLIEKPAVYIVTRNTEQDKKYLCKIAETTDWGKKVKCLVFER